MSKAETTNCGTRMEDSEAKLDRLERLLLKVIEHADDGMSGSDEYARDRLRQCRVLAAVGVERIIGKDLPMPTETTADHPWLRCRDEQCRSFGRCGASPFSCSAEPTTASRIAVNIGDYRDAAGEVAHLTYRMHQSQAKMRRALENLQSLGAHEEVEKLNARRP